MQIHIEDVSPVEKQLDVEIPWDHVREKLDAAYRELGKGVQVRGFRKGKVPRNVLERMFARQVHQEVARELVQESFLRAAEEHQIEPVAEPVVHDASLKPNEAFRYKARIEVRGKVVVESWGGIEGKRPKVDVSDEELERALEHERRMHTEFKAISGRTSTAASDVVIVSIKGKVGEFPVDRPEISVDLGEPQHEPLPGLAAALTGIPVDAKEYDVELAIPEDTAQKEIAGQTAKLAVTIRDAREKIVPALDDEFAKDTGEAQTLDELREKLKNRILDGKRQSAEREARDSVLKELIAKHQIPIASTLVERGIDSQIQRARYTFAMQGIDLSKTGVDLDAMREKLRAGAADEVRGQLLLEAIADQEKLEVTDDEVDQKVVEYAAQQGKPANKLKAEMDRDGTLASVKWRLRQEKALDLVTSRATITEVEPAAAAATATETATEPEPAAEPRNEEG